MKSNKDSADWERIKPLKPEIARKEARKEIDLRKVIEEAPIERIDVNLIDPPICSMHVTKHVDLGGTIKAVGAILQNVGVKRCGDRFQCVWGFGRVQCYRDEGRKWIEAKVFSEDLPDAWALKMGLIENFGQRHFDAVGASEALNKYMALVGFKTKAELIEDLKVNPSRIADSLILAEKAHPKTIEAIEKEVISRTTAVKIVKVLPQEEQPKLIKKIQEEDLGPSAIRAELEKTKIISDRDKWLEDLNRRHKAIKELMPFSSDLGALDWREVPSLDIKEKVIEGKESGLPKITYKLKEHVVHYVLSRENDHGEKFYLACVDENNDVIISGLTYEDAEKNLRHEHVHYNIAVAKKEFEDVYNDVLAFFMLRLRQFYTSRVEKANPSWTPEQVRAKVNEMMDAEINYYNTKTQQALKWSEEKEEKMAKWLTEKLSVLRAVP